MSVKLVQRLTQHCFPFDLSVLELNKSVYLTRIAEKSIAVQACFLNLLYIKTIHGVQVLSFLFKDNYSGREVEYESHTANSN